MAHTPHQKMRRIVFRKDLAEQLRSGRVENFPWEVVKLLSGLWLSPLLDITPLGRKPRLIYDLSWSGLDAKAAHDAPKEEMRFRISLQHLIDFILAADMALEPKSISKFESADAYMRIWVRLEDLLVASFLVPMEKDSASQLIDVYLFMPMGYVDSVPLFCVVTKTVKDRALNNIHTRGQLRSSPWKHW